MLGFRASRFVVLWGALAGLACGDDGPTNRPPSDDTTSATTPFTTSPSTSLSGSATEDGSDTDDSGTDTGDASDTSSTSEGLELCAAQTHRCVAEVPEGWEGPGPAFVAEADARRPACDAPYPDGGTIGFEGLEAPEATCGCGCGEPNDAECDNDTTLRFWGSAEECNEGASTQITVFSGVCINLPSPFPADSYWQVDVIESSGGVCASDEEVVVEDVAWQSQIVTCGGADLLGGCTAGNVCAPRPETEDTPLCVWRVGEHECPEGYDTPRTLFTDVSDARGCAVCTCSDPVGVCDDARVTLTGTANCNVPIANQFDVDGECHAGSGIDVRAAVLAAGLPNAFCTPSDPMPVGEAIGADPITLCCAE